MEESCIWETLKKLTNADSSTKAKTDRNGQKICLGFCVPDNYILLRFGVPDNTISLHLGVLVSHV